MNNKIKQFRDGLFQLNTRRFGIVAEKMVQLLFTLRRKENIFDDLMDNKVEIAFSRALEKHEESIHENIIEQCINCDIKSRMVKYKDRYKKSYSCNFQQLKRNNFDYLIYGIFFKDKIIIFRIESDKIDKSINYSNKQHKNGKDEGQFHIDKHIIKLHEDNYYAHELTYNDLYNMLLSTEFDEDAETTKDN